MRTVRTVAMRTWRGALGCASCAALAAALLIGCGKENWRAPDEPIVDPVGSLGDIRASILQVAEAGGTSLIEVDVLGLDGDPVAGVEVSFTATLGTISPTGVSDGAGVARAVFTAGDATGFARVVAGIPGMQRELTLLVGEGTLAASAASILANGTSYSFVSGTVPAPEGGSAEGRAVRFATTAGTLSVGETVSGAGGYVSTILTSSVSDSDVGASVTLTDANDPELLLGGTLVVFRGISLALAPDDSVLLADGTSQTTVRALLREATSGAALTGENVNFIADRGAITSTDWTDGSGEATATFTVPAAAGAARIIAQYLPGVADTAFITLSNVQLTVTSAADTLVADGGSTTTLTAWLGDPLTGLPIPGERVDFRTNLGQVDAFAVTNGAGQASVTLQTGVAAGACRVIASYQGGIESAVFVEFIRPTLSGLWLSVSPDRVMADGLSDADVRVVVALAGGVAAPDGTPVTFSTGAGVITPIAFTDRGVATATLTPAGGPQLDVPVIAASGGMRDTVYVDFIAGLPELVQVRVEPDTLAADGSATAVVTASLYDNAGNAVENGTLVTFRATRGVVTGAALTWNGSAQALFTAGTQAGLGTLIAEAYPSEDDTVRASATVTLTSGSPGDILLTADRAAIGVAGVGGAETATFTARVLDGSGNPVPDGTLVSFEIISGPGGGECLNTPAVGYGPLTMPSAGGVARVTLRSGTASGPVNVEASSGGIFNSGGRVIVNAGPPANILIGWEQGATIDEGEACVWHKLITALVQDSYGNAVEDSTAVHFSLTSGARALIEGSTITGVIPDHGCQYDFLWPSLQPASGKAYTCLSYSSVDLFDAYGIVARASSGGSIVADTLLVSNTMIDPTIGIGLSPAAVDSSAGGVVDVGATVRDGCGFYVTGATVIFSADHPGVSFTSPVDVTFGGYASTQMIAPPGLGAVTITVTASVGFGGPSANATVTSR